MSWFSNPRKCNCVLSNSIFIDIDGFVYPCHGCSYVKNKDYLKIGKTDAIQDLEKFISDNSFDLPENHECLRCEATYCAICHATNMNETIENLANDWVKNRSNDKIRCKYYQIFGKIYNAYKLGLMV